MWYGHIMWYSHSCKGMFIQCFFPHLESAPKIHDFLCRFYSFSGGFPTVLAADKPYNNGANPCLCCPAWNLHQEFTLQFFFSVTRIWNPPWISHSNELDADFKRFFYTNWTRNPHRILLQKNAVWTYANRFYFNGLSMLEKKKGSAF